MVGLITKKHKGLGGKESLLLLSLARKGKKIFTIGDAGKIVKKPKKTVFSLARKGWILRLKRGLYALVPLEIGPKGASAFTVHNFVIASCLTKPYYVGYWTALNYYGLTDQVPRTVFVAALKPKKSVKILSTEFCFVKLVKKKFFGFKRIRIGECVVNISSKEKTIADCLDHPEHSAGIEEVAKAIFFNYNELDIERIEAYLVKMNNLTAVKRLGFILDSCNLDYRVKSSLSRGFGLLDTLSPKKGPYCKKWLLLINKEINPKKWFY